MSSPARFWTLALWLLWSWVAMTVTHELGHVVGGVVGGAKVTQLELRPWRLPHSTFIGDAHPLVTLWAGPLLGCAVPLLAAAARRQRSWWFVAWFCVVANASYLLLGYVSGDAQLDSARMLRAGTPAWVLIVIATVALAGGYVKFRAAVAELMSQPTVAMSPAQRRRSAAMLAAVLILQAVVGWQIHAAL